jgi:hypothetical protein
MGVLKAFRRRSEAICESLCWVDEIFHTALAMIGRNARATKGKEGAVGHDVAKHVFA